MTPRPLERARTWARTPTLATTAAIAWAAAALPTIATAASSSQSQIDFDSLGSVAVVGSFAGLTLYDPSATQNTYSSAAATLVSRSQSGDLSELGATDTGGSISAVCQSPSGTVYVGGNFTSFGATAAANIAAYDPATDAFAALGTGLDGEVLALSCNDTTVYAGGSFTGPVDAANGEYAGSVAEWAVGTASWSPLPFNGLNGPVNTITPSEDGKSLFFGGNFSTTFINGSISSTTITNTTAEGNATTFQSLGSSLSSISLNTSYVTATPTTYLNGFGRPSYIFCPRREDGPSASWLLVDGNQGYIVIELRREVTARGIRLGNTFYGGRGTKNFTITSIPDDQVLELQYYSNASDPNSALATCSDDCQMAHDESVEYQDFLFTNATTMTGFQMTFIDWYGDGAGLHLMELLSEGSYTSAVSEYNLNPCTSGLGATTQSNVTTTGNWTEVSAVSSSTAGTTNQVLEATVGTSTATAPSVTWSPYVKAAGNYSIYLQTPGCSNQGDCADRTTVSVVVDPTGGASNTSTVSQTNTADESSLIYDGYLEATSGTSTSVTVTLSAGSSASGTIIANSITLVALNTTATINSTNTNTTDTGYGLFEYALVGTGTFDDAVESAASENASSTLTNATTVDDVAFGISQGGVVRSIVTAGSGTAATVFIGGSFTYVNGTTSSANLVAVSSSAVTAAPNGGLAGEVTSLVASNGTLYAAGTFTATTDGTVTGLGGVAQWTYTNSSVWAAVGSVPSALAGSVVALGLSNNGSADHLFALGAGSEGYASFDLSASSWNSTPSGFLVANLTAYSAAGNSSNSTAASFLAGTIVASGGMASPGGAYLSSNSDGSGKLTSLGYSFQALTESASSSNATTATRRVRRDIAVAERSWSSFVPVAPTSERVPRQARGTIMERERSSLAKSSTAAINTTLPTSHLAQGDSSTGEVLAGTFWKNGSNTLMLIGGNFVSADGIANVGLYDSKAQSLAGLTGQNLTGTVEAVAVFDDVAWIGGNFTAASGRWGLTTYDLDKMAIDESQPALTGYGGSNATVNAIAQRPGYDETIIVAGAFAKAGLLQCQSICSWDTETTQWSALGDGLQGAVGAITFGGAKSQYLIAAGQFTVNSTTAYIAMYDYSSMSWSYLGQPTDLPGPATAVSTDSHNVDKVFVAGVSNTDLSPYVRYWNSSAWADVNSNGLEQGSEVTQLVFVPVKDNHASNEVIESDRMLLVSGDLTINSTAMSAALFDGASWYPYLIATAASGAAGSIANFYYSDTNFNLSASHHLSVGIVILISMAIALGVVFLLVLIGVLVALARRRDEPAYPPQEQRDSAESVYAHRAPNDLLATVGAATAVLLDGNNGAEKAGAAGGAGGAAAAAGDEKRHRAQDPGSGSNLDHDSIAGPAGYGAGAAEGADGDDEVLSYDSHQFGDAVARTRYSFEAEHPGELTVRAGEDLVILEGSDPNWFLVMNGTGQRGLMPASFLA